MYDLSTCNPDSLGFWIPRCGLGTGFQIPCQWNLDSRFQSLALFRIPRTEFRILKPRIRDATRKNLPGYGIWITLRRTKKEK